MFQNRNISNTSESENDKVSQKPTYLQRQIENTKDIRHYCPHCKKSFMLIQDLPMHIQTEHDKLALRCDVCFFQTNSGKELKLHERLSHVKELKVQA